MKFNRMKLKPEPEPKPRSGAELLPFAAGYPWPVFAILALVNAAPAAADSSQLTLSTQLQNNRLYHGLSETDNNAHIRFNSDYALNRFVYSGLEYSHARARDQLQRHHNINAYIAADYPLDSAQHWFLGASIKQRHFIQSHQNWDYREWALQLWHHSGGRIHGGGRIEYLPDYYAQGRKALLLHSAIALDLSEQFYGHFSVNQLQVENNPQRHYAVAAAGFRHQRFASELAWHWQQDAGQRVVGGEVADSQLQLSLSYQLF